MEQNQEKDNFWLYIGGVIIAVMTVLMMVKGSEHDKYVTAQKAISEDSANSAYRAVNVPSGRE
ncbi:hypothetical protein SAMN02949497_3231 [Methylomagnum ishizawai]|uniref:Uncharacterized protein n=1 Tax=Methylomagnum ishizawai TaxID=1760988 RepID=A0A1Y6CZV9_9GAMM|nr:hypothetical protein [Methylomagnum ishizawai]SMF95856.1 hypothetical protein SAMN02949497_3231 [Methylomagnum ishizawai]